MEKEFLKDPIFWITVLGSTGTFIVAIIALINLYRHRKEKIERETVVILEKVIRPLKLTLEKIIEEIPKGNLSDFTWDTIEKDYPQYGYLLLKRHREIAQKIKDFNHILKRFRNLYHQRWNELNKLFYQEIFNYLRQQGSPKTQRVLENLYKQSYPEDSVRYWYCYWQIGGKSYSRNLFELIFFKKSLQEFIEESKDDPEILNKEISEIKCSISDENIEKEHWDAIRYAIERKIKENKSYIEYFEASKEIYNEAWRLKDKLENFVRKIGK